MIIANKIIFGDGTIAVGCNIIERYISFEYINQHQEIGTKINVNDELNTMNEIRLVLNLKELIQFRNLLDNVENNKVFEFKGYVFDFSNFNQKSVNVVISYCKDLSHWMTMAYAC